jgi:flavin reductase (DIM6/NTAB) family NADH-FMN oxidoreductase RutF
MLDPESFRQTMRHWTTGISIFAAHHQGMIHGMTVSSFTSVALEPPQVLASIQKGTRTYELADLSGAFSITILSTDQLEISERFAGRLEEDQDRFEDLSTETLVTGSPFIQGGLAYLDCRVRQQVDLGSHMIFIGEVVAVREFDRHKPLLYYNRAYRMLQE